MANTLPEDAFAADQAGAVRFAAVDTTLRDGRVVHIRSMCSADEAELLQAFDRLSPDARYMRFMRVVREVNLKRMRQVLSSFPEHGDAIVATVGAADGIDIVGSATFVLLDDPATCEFAISVAGGAVKVDGANVVSTDIAGSNGVIHVIDSVILPK